MNRSADDWAESELSGGGGANYIPGGSILRTEGSTHLPAKAKGRPSIYERQAPPCVRRPLLWTCSPVMGSYLRPPFFTRGG